MMDFISTVIKTVLFIDVCGFSSCACQLQNFMGSQHSNGVELGN